MSTDQTLAAEAAINQVARLLFDHAQALLSGRRHSEWIGETELRRRTLQLISWCSNAGLPLPWRLLHLTWFLLYPEAHPLSGKSLKLQRRWATAARKESEIPASEGEPYAPNVVSKVARAAFPEGGDHRRTIRDWRDEPAYRALVLKHRADRRIIERRNSGEMNDDQEMLLREKEFFAWCAELTTGLRRAADKPLGRKTKISPSSKR